MIEIASPLSDKLSRRDALKALSVVGFAGMISQLIAQEETQETKLPPLPEIKTKEEARDYLQKTLHPAVSQALSALANEKQWNYTTDEKSFQSDIVTATKTIPALIQLEELIAQGWIIKNVVFCKYLQQSEYGIDVRVKDIEGGGYNGFYWSSQSINPEWRGSL